MAKYSIIFYGSALLVALLLSKHRKLLWTWYLPVTLVGGLLVILPNLIWQYQHNWPAISHRTELQETQLGNVLLTDFIFAQVFMHLPALTVWLGGLIFLLFNLKYNNFRVFAWAFILTLLLIILLRGKFYYTIAAYTILIVFGGIAWERWSQKTGGLLGYVVLVIILLSGIVIVPFSLPIYKPGRMVEYDRKLVDRGLEVMLKWEDGQVHELPQDYADMLGWDELGRKVWAFYDSLEDSIKANTLVYGENYGMAGATRYFRPGNSYPEVHSFNDAFMEWIPEHLDRTHVIFMGFSDILPQYFEELEMIGTVEDLYFRERGLPVYFGSYPKQKLYDDWEETWQESAGNLIRERKD